MKTEKILIGAGHLVRAMQLARFGHEEIMAVLEAMKTGDWGKIEFIPDVYNPNFPNENE